MRRFRHGERAVSPKSPRAAVQEGRFSHQARAGTFRGNGPFKVGQSANAGRTEGIPKLNKAIAAAVVAAAAVALVPSTLVEVTAAGAVGVRHQQDLSGAITIQS